jgi:prepilin-type N-terminal cleavage/methylation domain-containing protein
MSGPARRGGFTLIELLAVITIMAILLALTIGAFTKIGEAAALKGAMSEVRGALVLARQTAVAKRVPTALLVLDADADPYYSIPNDMKHLPGRAYAIVDMQNLRYVRGWSELPRNVVFNSRIHPGDYDGEPGNNILRFSDRASSPDCQRNVPFPLTPGALFNVDLMGVLFLPDGQSQGGGGSSYWYHWLIVSEGTKDATGVIRYRQKSDGTDTRSFGLRVSHAGSVKMKEFPDNGT